MLLQADLDRIQAEVLELESSFPELGAPFNVFNRGLDLAEASQLELFSIVISKYRSKGNNFWRLILEEYDLELVGTWPVACHLLKESKRLDWILW